MTFILSEREDDDQMEGVRMLRGGVISGVRLTSRRGMRGVVCRGIALGLCRLWRTEQEWGGRWLRTMTPKAGFYVV